MCVQEGFLCLGEDIFKDYFKEAEKIIQTEVNAALKKQPSWTKIFAKPRIKVDLSQFKIKSNYECKNQKVTPELFCKKIINNGNENDKADIIFIGNEYTTFDELEEYVRKIIDYEGINANTIDEGFFSVEPFKTHKNKFNIWIIPGKNLINYEFEGDPSEGKSPKYEDILNIATKCVKTDYIISVSKNYFRSDCYFGNPSVCRLENSFYPGRLLLHEMGHGFANLEDEYYNDIEEKNEKTTVEEIKELNIGPNCVATKKEAEQSWGNLIRTNNNLGYFEGCGGDCGSYCKTHIRPTPNSIMNNQYCMKGHNPNDENSECSIKDSATYQKISPPPYDQYYAVNTREIIKKLNNYK